MQASAEAGVPPANTIDAWVLGHVSQAVLAVNAMAWTAEVERALDTLVWEHDGGAALQSVCDDTSAHLETCVRRVRRSLASKLEHASIGAFLVRTVYHRYVPFPCSRSAICLSSACFLRADAPNPPNAQSATFHRAWRYRNRSAAAYGAAAAAPTPALALAPGLPQRLGSTAATVPASSGARARGSRRGLLAR